MKLKKCFAAFKKNMIERFSGDRRGQSFVELALVFPVIIILLLVLVEAVLFIGRYLDILDLTREAARFASVRDPFDTNHAIDQDCSTQSAFDFYYDTACIFSPPSTSACTDPAFCNGINNYIQLNPATDDVVIRVFSITNSTTQQCWPDPTRAFGSASAGNCDIASETYWALSDHDSDTAHNDNWTRNCNGGDARTVPYYTDDFIDTAVATREAPTPSAPTSKGFVTVEFYYCYSQALGFNIVENPIQIHAYSIMPLPAGQPTPSPTPFTIVP